MTGVYIREIPRDCALFTTVTVVTIVTIVTTPH